MAKENRDKNATVTDRSLISTYKTQTEVIIQYLITISVLLTRIIMITSLSSLFSTVSLSKADLNVNTPSPAVQVGIPSRTLATFPRKSAYFRIVSRCASRLYPSTWMAVDTRV